MPTPSRTSLPEIVAAGRSILETDGLEALTMQRVAEAVGVRSPSLYKRVRGRGDLIRLIADSVADELAATMEAATKDGAATDAAATDAAATDAAATDAAAADRDPATDLRAIAHAFRAFALANPNAYALVFARLPEDARVDPERNARAAETLLRTAGRLAGPDHALDAARTVTAWAHGFLTMELAGAFRLGGDVDQAFAYGIEHLSEGLRR